MRGYRTITTDAYQLSIQKNGLTHVLLASGEPVFLDVNPLVWFDGENAPRKLDVDGRLTQRTGIHNYLGEGQGLMFKKGNAEWFLHAYPTKPFMTVQVAFVNDTKKTVKVKMLIPWAVGNPGKGSFSLGPSTAGAVFLENGRSFQDNGDMPKRVTGESQSVWNLAAYDAVSQRSLITGFLTNARAWTQFKIERSPKAGENAFDLFRAECVYDPPIEVPPNGRLESELLYLSIAERDPWAGLERYGDAFAAFNGIRRAKAFLPHGWDSWNTQFKSGISEDRMLAELNVVDSQLKRYGWTHFAIDEGWAIGRGNWESDPVRFPHGMKWFADQIHARGMSAGIWIDPFTVDLAAPVAQAHPEWLLAPNAAGRENMAPTERILDVTIPEAYAHVRDTMAQIGQTWGFDALQEADFVYRLLYAESYANKTLTRPEVMALGMAAIRDGFGANKFITTFTPLPVSAPFANAMRIGDDCAPLWRKQPGQWPWGCVETLTNAARRYYFGQYVWATDIDCAYFGHADTRARWDAASAPEHTSGQTSSATFPTSQLHASIPELTWDQTIAWLTGAALTGGVIKIGDAFTSLSEKELAVLKRLLPAPDRPARPVDLFERDNPRIWSLPIKSAIGNWQIAAVFNWDETAGQTTPLSFAQLGLEPDAYYAVYDFWRDTYYGVAQRQLNVEVPPASVRLLCLRRYEDHPMFLSTDRHYTQGATDFTALQWNPQTRQLAGTFNAIANTGYNLRVLVPESYTPSATTTSIGQPTTQQEGRILRIAFHCATDASLTWSVQF